MFGSVLSNSDIKVTNAYGSSFALKKNSLVNLTLLYFGVFHLGARIRTRILKKIIEKKDYKNSNLLDAGCGIGLISIYLYKNFKSIYGMDIDKEKIDQANLLIKNNNIKNVTFKLSDLLKIKTNKKFDVIICFEVIEHVKDPKKLLNNFSKILKKNGELILSFPSNSLISALAQKSLGHEVAGFLPLDIKKFIIGKNLKVKKQYTFGNSFLGQGIIALDFFIKKFIPLFSFLLFPFFYPLVVADLFLPVMGTPRGYILVLEKN